MTRNIFYNMYQYIYDGFLSDKKYDKVLTRIENRLLDLGINGKVNKITVLKNFESYIKELVDKKPDVIIIVGNDKTLAKTLNIVADKEIILGIIPIGNENTIADFFGISREEQACDIIAARRIEEIDLGNVNGQYFLSSVEIFGAGTTIICNDSYEIKALENTEKIGIYNLCLKDNMEIMFNPQDKNLEIISTPKISNGFFNFNKNKPLKKSLIRVLKARILSSRENNSVLVDAHKIMKTPAEVTVSNRKLKIIVGKNRKF